MNKEKRQVAEYIASHLNSEYQNSRNTFFSVCPVNDLIRTIYGSSSRHSVHLEFLRLNHVEKYRDISPELKTALANAIITVFDMHEFLVIEPTYAGGFPKFVVAPPKPVISNTGKCEKCSETRGIIAKLWQILS